MKKNKTLIIKLLENKISEKEVVFLKEWLYENDSNKFIFKEIVKDYNKNNLVSFDADIAFNKFNKATRKTVFKLKSYYKYVAAIVIGLFVTLNLYLKPNLNNNQKTTNTTQVVSEINTDDIIITLSDGTKKNLSNSNQTSLTDANGNIVAEKDGDGLLFNDLNDSSNKVIKYNEIYIPNGKTFKIILSDGTKVWLNSETHFKFPQDFKYQKNKRLVTLDGEALFDVTSNKLKPFIVDNKGLDIKVLGTIFNVSSYSDDNIVATTLVEGKVLINEDGKSSSVILAPGHQSVYDKLDKSMSRQKVDTEIFTSWIHKKFVINSLSFDEILKRLERKFDVTFINKTSNLKFAKYKGEFTNESLETILKTISLSTKFKYDINDKIITITN